MGLVNREKSTRNIAKKRILSRFPSKATHTWEKRHRKKISLSWEGRTIYCHFFVGGSASGVLGREKQFLCGAGAPDHIPIDHISKKRGKR